MPPKQLVLADTNILLRYLLRDDPKQFIQASHFIENSPDGSIYLPDAVFLEIGYVLLSYYKVPKAKVVSALGSLIQSEKFSLDMVMLRQTLKNFLLHSVSLVDSYILAQLQVGPVSKVKTFDKRLRQLVNQIG